MKITTLPVYSKLADEANIPLKVRGKLPTGWRLSQHQVETYNALIGGEHEVVFNTAMTGDGKSLAAQLPMIVKGGVWWKTLALYPTNELIEDQRVNFEKTKDRWAVDALPEILNGATLDQMVEEDKYTRRGDALMRVFKNNDLVLSNPDIFHYIMHQFYNYQNDAPDRYSGELTQMFSQLTFDEFHIFEAPQIVSVLNALLFMHAIGGSVRPHKFLFLSATPNELMLAYLRNSGLETREVKGEYATEGGENEWRRILHQAEINIESEPRAEAWVEQHLDDVILPFFVNRRPNAKGAIIVNSVASAYRIFNRIKPIFERHHLTVELNTGMTGRSRRKDSYDADLLIGTSTVDVGVDFQINFLVFESHDAGSFLQRLGRLGRHNGYERNGQTYHFQDYVAYALVPDWIAARLFKSKEGEPALLIEGATLDRRQFNGAIQTAYPPVTSFEHYARTWGQMQSIRILQGMSSKPIRDEYKETRERLQKRYEGAFGLKFYFSKYAALFKDQSPVLKEALSFRGGDEFPCCVIDPDEKHEPEQFKNADLLRLVANSNLESLSKEAFYAAARQAGLKVAQFEDREPLGFFRLHGVSDERQNFKFFLDENLMAWDANEFGVAKARHKFTLDADFPDRVDINNRLYQRELPTLLCAGQPPLEMKRRLRLPLLFPLFEFVSRDGRTGTVAFGRTALMLESSLLFRSLPCGGGAVII